MDDDAPRDLRARRRRDTHEEIHHATLELFETQGVRETTVQQIADRAGVSARTFFRYFTSKEQAALPSQRRLFDAIAALEVPPGTPAAAVLTLVEEASAAAMTGDSEPEMHEHRRVARLLAREPDLQALAAAQELALTRALRERLDAQAPDLEPVAAQLVAEVAVRLWRTSWDRWSVLVLQREATNPVDVYESCRAELRRVVR